MENAFLQNLLKTRIKEIFPNNLIYCLARAEYMLLAVWLWPTVANQVFWPQLKWNLRKQSGLTRFSWHKWTCTLKKYWHWLLREAVGTPLLAVFKSRLYGAVSNLIYLKISPLTAGGLD